VGLGLTDLETQQWLANSLQQRSSNYHTKQNKAPKSLHYTRTLIKFPEKNLPRQQGSNGGVIPQPNPIYEEGPPKENLKTLETPLTNRLTHRPQKPGRRAKREE